MDNREYWNRHGKDFADLYERKSLFNRVFRRALYLRAKMTVEEIARTAGATVLDVGCGPGRNSVLFVTEGKADRVTGIDLSEEMIQMAEHLAEEYGVTGKCSFITGDFMDVDLGQQKFDYAVALGVMDYIRDPVPMLTRMREHTRCAAIASFPGLDPLRTLLRKVRYGLRGMRVYWYSKDRIRRILAEAGFAECRIVRCTAAGNFGIGIVDEGGRECSAKPI